MVSSKELVTPKSNNMNTRVFKTNEKYLNFLTDVYSSASNDGKFKMRAILSKYKMSGRVSSILMDRGIIKKYKSAETGIMYRWNTRQPDIRMANAVRKALNEETYSNKLRLDAERNNKTVAVKKTEVKSKKVEVNRRKPTPKKEVVTNKEFSFMWGLIKIKY